MSGVAKALGALLVLAGLYLVISGAPQVQSDSTSIWDIIKLVFGTYPRVAIGLVLIVLGAALEGVANLF
jgi:hypothetical protein